MRRPVRDVLDRLLAASEATRAIGLDQLGDAIGAMAIAPPELEELFEVLESTGRRIVAPEGGGGEARLGEVLAAARALRGLLGRTPTVAEIAEKAAMSERDVRRALLLSEIIQR